jgi:hypothetical protein
MSEPIAEQIMAALRTRVATYRATTFRSSKIATWQPKNNTIHVFQEGIDDNPAIDCPGNPPAKGYTLNAVAAVILKPSDTDATAIDTYKNRSWAEVVKAITSVHLWHNWSGLAIIMKASWRGNVFKRVGKSRLPIVKLMGASPWGVFTKQKMTPEQERDIKAELVKQMDRRIKLNILRAEGLVPK